ncbi:MAG: hypothetical protein IJA58_06605, partial [Lachnospiraceae bacterium]|nr:hypothetical protein [Lachnospiraceae bacterium]
MKEMSVLEFMNRFDDWEARITQPPFFVNVKHDGEYVLLKYQQLNSDMNMLIVQESRGSIFRRDADGRWRYVCRPFDKFFNVGESQADQIDWSTARVLQKVDGSLIKLWYDEGEWHLSTNGMIDAFKSSVPESGYRFGDVFNRALGMDFRVLGDYLDPDYTYLFELTSPDTKLVIPYPDGVWYLSRRHTESGVEEFDRPELPGVKLPKQFFLNRLEDVLSVVSGMSKEEEGVVVNDARSHRIKIKSPEYLLAAHLMNNKMISNRNLVTYMQEGKIDDFLAYCPRYQEHVQDILDCFQNKCASLDALWEKYRDMASLPRGEFAKLIERESDKNYLFVQYDRPEMSSASFLLGQQTPALMRMLGIKADVLGGKD